MANSVPTLTGLTTPVTFLENGAPQIIDANVTFTDADNNFDTGTLTVAHLLAEDTVAIRNQGSGAGQIGVAGSDVTFGGTLIGSFAGGAGSTLTVTFNAAATAQAIEALIENLTYANSSDAPTASHSLELKVTDAAGAAIAPAFAEQTGAANPFNGVAVGLYSMPSFADLDGDGDLDAVVGAKDGTLHYYENTGSAIAPAFTEQTGAANPFDGVDVGIDSSPSFADLDGDGDLDAVVGTFDGTLLYFENTGSALAPAFTEQTGAANPFNGIGIDVWGADVTPSFADLDGDGDLDAVVGNFDGTLHYFQNTGTAIAAAFTGAANPFNGVGVGSWARPSFADLDGDGDLDAVVGEVNGTLRYFENTGSAIAPAFTQQTGAANPFNGVDVGSFSNPSFADLDGDGDLDAVVGELFGTLRYFENTGAGFTLVVNVTAEDDAAVLSADVRNLTETNAAADISSSGTLTISDPDSPATFVAQAGTLGNYGTFAIDSAGAWTYAASSAHNEFVAGTTYTDTFQVLSADGTPTSVTINIGGTNDAVVLSADVRDLTEANTAAAISSSGTLTISDPDSAASFVAQAGTLGNYGTFVIDSAGAWTYAASSAHNEFVAGTTYTDTFQVASADGTPTSVIINILGTGDAAVPDFSSDSKSDILWQHNNGTVAAWLMDGTTATTVTTAGSFNPGPAWHVKGSGDFDGDGKSDIIWQHDNGTAAMWLMDGANSTFVGAVGPFNPGPTWHIEGTGDFNGDGKSDIIWQGDNGTASMWLMDGTNTTFVGAVGPFNPGPAWHIKGTGDFNGDGKSDIIWQGDNGTASMWLMDGTNTTFVGAVGPFNPGPSWQIKGTGDFNGDGKSDIIWQHDNGTAAMWLMDGTNATFVGAVGPFNPGPTWEIKGTGDFNGDGKSDILWQGQDGTPAIWLMDGTNVLSVHAAGSFNPGHDWHVIA